MNVTVQHISSQEQLAHLQIRNAWTLDRAVSPGVTQCLQEPDYCVSHLHIGHGRHIWQAKTRHLTVHSCDLPQFWWPLLLYPVHLLKMAAIQLHLKWLGGRSVTLVRAEKVCQSSFNLSLHPSSSTIHPSTHHSLYSSNFNCSAPHLSHLKPYDLFAPQYLSLAFKIYLHF